MTPLAEWENFYVIVGSSAGALIGLQFVVMTLIAGMPHASSASQGSDAFATPTVVHFGVVLLLSALISAPWHAVAGPAVAWGILGLAGAFYQIIVVHRMRIQTIYKPQLEDWLFHALFPSVAYAALVASACVIPTHPHAAMLAVGGAALLLLFTGIHNAWDAVTYHIFTKGKEHRNPDAPHG